MSGVTTATPNGIPRPSG